MVASTASFGRTPYLQSRALRIFLVALLLAVASLLLLLVGIGALFLPLIALFIAGMLALATITWPVQTMLATLVLVTLSRFMSLLFYAATGSSLAVRASQLIKDELLIFLLIAVVNVTFRRKQMPRLRYLDLMLVFYVAVSLLYIAYNGPEGNNTSLVGKVLAVRQDAFFLLAYFVGRGIPFTRNTAVWMVRILVVMSAVLGLVAAAQFVAPGIGNLVFRLLGFDGFMRVIGTAHEELAVRSRGIAGADLPRSSSLFLSDLGLAYYQVIVIPLVAALFFYARQPRFQFAYGALLVLMIAAVGMTITRTAIGVSVLGLGFVLLRTSSYLKAAVVAVALGTAGLAGLLVLGVDPASLGSLLSAREGSAIAHFDLIENAIRLVQTAPLGLGLGNGSHVANLLGGYGVQLDVSAAESWYFQLALEMGALVALFFGAMLVYATINATITSFRVQDPLLKVITLTVAASGLSLTILGLLQPVWAATHVTYLFWLLTGLSIRALDIEREWQEEEAAA